jgi:hypothetical protein
MQAHLGPLSVVRIPVEVVDPASVKGAGLSPNCVNIIKIPDAKFAMANIPNSDGII